MSDETERPEGTADDAVERSAELAAEGTTDDAVVEDAAPMEEAQLKAIVEAIVFASPEPATLAVIRKVLPEEPDARLEATLAALAAEYAERPGLQIVQVAGGYQIVTRPDLHEWVRRLFHERTTQKLSVQALETLAVIAYRQPVTAAEVTEIRGVNASGVLSTLLERHLVKIVGRRNVVGRPFLYGTTREFLVRFGLKDIADLPKMEDMVAALGFEPPPLLVEKPVSEDMLPLEEEQAGDAPDA